MTNSLDSAVEQLIIDQAVSRKIPSRGTHLFGADEEICSQSKPCSALYRVISGAVRVSRTGDDGRRQIIGFYYPGDIFGFALGRDYQLSASAICESKIESLNDHRGEVDSRDPVDHRALRLAVAELGRAQEHIFLLVQSADERVASFLSQIAVRLKCRNSVTLPMNRRDMADYLGLTIETISRILTRFEDAGFVRLVTSREIQLLKPFRSIDPHLKRSKR